MAKLTQASIFGVDISKEELVVWDWLNERQVKVANDPEAIRDWLRGLARPAQLAVEPTSSYHLKLVEQAHQMGFEVFLVNPRQLSHYRQAVGGRNKTDPDDARLLARFLAHERAQLRPYTPSSREAQQLWSLLKRRAVIVTSQQALRQSLSSIKLTAEGLWSQLAALLRRIDQQMLALIRKLGWWEDYRRCLSIPGVGPLNAAALVSVFHRGAFASADAFVAFIGMDVRLRESGSYKGKRKLTKRGESEVRRLLYCATQPALAYRPFATYHARQLDKGLAKTAAKVVLARKIARIAFALMTKQQSFNRETSAAC